MKIAQLILLCAALASCDKDREVPTDSESRQLDSASNLLDQAPNELDAIGEQLPPANQSDAPSEGSR